MYNYNSGYQYPQIGQQYGAVQQQYQQPQTTMPQNQMMQQYAYNNQPVYQALKGRPVTNFEEANAAMIDLDGSTFVFPCESQKRIYTKQIGLDGNPIVRTYILEEKQENIVVTEQAENKEYVLKTDYEKAIKKLETKINKLIKGGTKNESNGCNDPVDDGAA